MNNGGQLVRWRYRQLQANTANMSSLLEQVNDAAIDGWELVELAYADKTIGLNSMHAVVRKALDHPPDPTDATTGWKPDPLGHATQRFWDGHVWTVHVRGSQLEAALDARRERTDELGPNAANACKSDDHDRCKRKWCTCRCHAA